MTHALKPEFLASRHQYDTIQRQKYILQYTNISKGTISLRQLCCKLFPSLLVSHTVMYYWVRVVSAKKIVIEPLITKELQEYLPYCDIVSELLPEAEAIPEGVRNKAYSRDLAKLINWSRIYTQTINKYRDIAVTISIDMPLICINKILDVLTAHVFL